MASVPSGVGYRGSLELKNPRRLHSHTDTSPGEEWLEADLASVLLFTVSHHLRPLSSEGPSTMVTEDSETTRVEAAKFLKAHTWHSLPRATLNQSKGHPRWNGRGNRCHLLIRGIPRKDHWRPSLQTIHHTSLPSFPLNQLYSSWCFSSAQLIFAVSHSKLQQRKENKSWASVFTSPC